MSAYTPSLAFVKKEFTMWRWLILEQEDSVHGRDSHRCQSVLITANITFIDVLPLPLLLLLWIGNGALLILFT